MICGVRFADYTHQELVAIAEVMLVRDAYRFDDEARAAFAEYLQLRVAQPRFANARSVRSALERAWLRQARRILAAGDPVGRPELMTLTAADVRASRVFSEGTAGA